MFGGALLRKKGGPKFGFFTGKLTPRTFTDDNEKDDEARSLTAWIKTVMAPHPGSSRIITTGNNTVATVKGNNRRAVAGAFPSGPTTSEPGNANTASVTGNNSSATAGPGDGNEAIIVGDNQTLEVPPQP